MRGGNDELDRLRSERTELENHYIDELVSGHMDRRDFLRRGSMIGMSVPLLGAILAACGGSSFVIDGFGARAPRRRRGRRAARCGSRALRRQPRSTRSRSPTRVVC